MEYVVVGICIVAVVAIAALLIYRRKRMNSLEGECKSDQDSGAIITQQTIELSQSDPKLDELVIQMEMLPVEAISDESKLVEITDSKVLARVNNLVPGLLQAGLSGSNAFQTAKAGSEVLYRAIIPAGAKLTNSKAMKGAVRGFYRGADGIKGHANLVAVQAQNGTAVAANTAAAAMGVASMVVGQYYMTQINAELGEISDGISKISDFQDNEFRGRIFSLVAHIKKIADFQVEILENDELRLSKITQLDNLEEECTQLLGQVNLTLAGFAKKNDLDYASYEKKLKEAQSRYTYQKALLDVLYKISDLRYTLHLGAVSREQCAALLPTYTKQVEDTQALLTGRHQTSVNRLGIDTDEIKRKRVGFDGVIHFIPGLFNDDLKFKAIDERTVEMITDQASVKSIVHSQDTSDLYADDVQLISKDGKIYYLPMDKAE
ncbi:hypothetical protein GKG03_02445 [Finegoldia sp. BIOML-A3]|uniref:hypothetical protein n=1 Tax=unclassified Finegoldia TaxID=2619637 RepID=UPI0012AFB69F|nr:MULTISPECIES: hypothetical protein [unclassified Finegoldia]MSA98539.1 hypothetical protein [Finegoldia sp. BIOML-A3]MSB92541.1 hypothetical protein [Finegoldia sp. BIOML-A4]